MGDSPETQGRGWIVVTRKGEGVEPNINTDYIYMHTTNQVTGTSQVITERVYMHRSNLVLILRYMMQYKMLPEGFLNVWSES